MQTTLRPLKLFGGVVICYRSVNLSTRALGFFCGPSFPEPEPEVCDVSKRVEDTLEPVHVSPFCRGPRRATPFPGSTQRPRRPSPRRCAGVRKDAHQRTGPGG